MIERNVFGQLISLKTLVVRMVALAFYPRFNWRNTTDIQGSSVMRSLPDRNVLFVSNHQTYFADVILIGTVIQCAQANHVDTLKVPSFLWRLKHNMYFVAASETMKKGLIPRIFALGGAVTVKRTWRESGQNIKREVDSKDTDSITTALKDGYVITFPQGTTTPFVQGRKGTAHLIKECRPVVVPVVINGFRRAFDKKGLFIKKKDTTLSAWFKPPLKIDYDAPVEDILQQIMYAIEQTEDFLEVKE